MNATAVRGDVTNLPPLPASDGYARLARAVILHAVRDARAGTWSTRASRDGARAFLRGDEGDLAFWCAIGRVNLSAVQRTARQLWPKAAA